jgi:uncharacterized membrane protein
LSGLLLISASFLASAVEMVEAMTIVLAVGITRGWRSTLIGAVCALVALGVLVAALGPSLVRYVPIQVLQVVVGTLLLIFGMQWMRKAVQRGAGLKAQHDEDLIFETEVSELVAAPTARTGALDWTGFVVSFKGVFLEGLEVAFIVLTFGANSQRFDLAAAGALGAFLLVGGVGLAVHRPLSRVPENTIKFAVGFILMAFGTFWGGEGVGLEWALGDLMIPILAGLYAITGFLLIAALRRRALPQQPAVQQGTAS